MRERKALLLRFFLRSLACFFDFFIAHFTLASTVRQTHNKLFFVQTVSGAAVVHVHFLPVSFFFLTSTLNTILTTVLHRFLCVYTIEISEYITLASKSKPVYHTQTNKNHWWSAWYDIATLLTFYCPFFFCLFHRYIFSLSNASTTSWMTIIVGNNRNLMNLMTHSCNTYAISHWLIGKFTLFPNEHDNTSHSCDRESVCSSFNHCFWWKIKVVSGELAADDVS